MQESFLYFSSLIFVFITHELGHLVAARKYNIISREINFGFYYIFPVFYTDLTEIWSLDKIKRIIINLSGIYFQFIIGVVLICIYFYTRNQIILNLFFSNFVISIVNLNPILKFDGYWVLSDYLGKNNLLEDSNLYFKSLFNKADKKKYGIDIKLYTFFRYVFIFYIYYLIIRFLCSTLYEFSSVDSLYDVDFKNIAFVMMIISYIGYAIYKKIKKWNIQQQ